MGKINIANLLKDCPKEMELYSPVCGECRLNFVDTREKYGDIYGDIIRVNFYNAEGEVGDICFYADGTYFKSGEVMLFPSKDQRDWSKFIRPFKNGDVITCTNSVCSFVAIFKETNTDTTFRRYVSLTLDDEQQFCTKERWSDFINPRFATEEEKQKLFDAIKANGYKWNVKTTTLEKLIEPKFKVGNLVSLKGGYEVGVINRVTEDFYEIKVKDKFNYVAIANQIHYELVTNKFDITTLKPFDKVLVRDSNKDKWNIDFFAYYRDIGEYQCMTFVKNQCIPYEGNEHLLGKTDDCDEFYKTWEE